MSKTNAVLDSGGSTEWILLVAGHFISYFQVFLLNTMRRYVPRIHLLPSPDGANFDYKIRNEFCFPETEFIAVSAYRNKQVLRLLTIKKTTQ